MLNLNQKADALDLLTEGLENFGYDLADIDLQDPKIVGIVEDLARIAVYAASQVSSTIPEEAF